MLRLSPHRVRTWAQRFRRLTPTDALYLLKALSVTVGMWTALRLVSVRQVLAWTESPVSGAGSIPADQQDRILWAVSAVNRRLFPVRPCLTQALAARYLLSRRGVPSTLRIGVTRGEEQALKAHAWLEQKGEVLIGGRESPDAYHQLCGAKRFDDREDGPVGATVQRSPRPRGDASS